MVIEAMRLGDQCVYLNYGVATQSHNFLTLVSVFRLTLMTDSDHRQLVVLKNRYTGQTGLAGTVHFNRETGRLLEEQLVQFTAVNDDQGST